MMGILAVLAASGAWMAYQRLQGANETRELDLGFAPDFTLTGADGQPFSSAELDGQVWLIDFFFTRCQGICPILTDRLLDVQDALADRDGWSLVSISVDPEHDTPEVLTEYARVHGIDLDRWTLLTGEKDFIFELIEKQFLLPVKEAFDNEEEPILHSPRIILVDADGKLHGYYDALDESAMDRLQSDAVALVDARP